jgi:deoxyadenosine/deoxycytidine kinase
MNTNKTIITIEGNIGTGKSTFTKILKSKWQEIQVIPEPISTWFSITDDNNKNILQHFYDDMDSWTFRFQIMAAITFMSELENIIKTSKSQYIFLDRSLYTGINVFEKMSYDNGKINKIEHTIYKLLIDLYEKYVKKDYKEFHIYLKCEPLISYERIKKRGRIEEKDIKYEYLVQLNKYHDDWLLKKSSNIIVIDCDISFENDENIQNEMIQKIKEKIISSKKDNNIENIIKLLFLCFCFYVLMIIYV